MRVARSTGSSSAHAPWLEEVDVDGRARQGFAKGFEEEDDGEEEKEKPK